MFVGVHTQPDLTYPQAVEIKCIDAMVCDLLGLNCTMQRFHEPPFATHSWKLNMNELFAICRTSEIDEEQARGFWLATRTESGEVKPSFVEQKAF